MERTTLSAQSISPDIFDSEEALSVYLAGVKTRHEQGSVGVVFSPGLATLISSSGPPRASILTDAAPLAAGRNPETWPGALPGRNARSVLRP